jgi:hypothetical protein
VGELAVRDRDVQDVVDDARAEVDGGERVERVDREAGDVAGELARRCNEQRQTVSKGLEGGGAAESAFR